MGLGERHVVEEAQGTDRLHDERPRDVPLMHEIELVLADLLGAQLLWGGPKVLGKLGDTAEISRDSFWGIVAQLEVIAHPLAQGGHRWTDGLHRPTPSREREALRRGIYAAHGGVIVVQGDDGWPEELNEREMTVLRRGCTRTE